MVTSQNSFIFDYTHESDCEININSYILERPDLRSLSVWVDDHFEPKNGKTTINWDQICQDFVDWTGRTITSKEVCMNGMTIVPIQINPSTADQVRDLNIYAIWKGRQVDIKQVFNGRPSNRQLMLCIQWPQSERFMFKKTGIVMKSWSQNS